MPTILAILALGTHEIIHIYIIQEVHPREWDFWKSLYNHLSHYVWPVDRWFIPFTEPFTLLTYASCERMIFLFRIQPAGRLVDSSIPGILRMIEIYKSWVENHGTHDGSIHGAAKNMVLHGSHQQKPPLCKRIYTSTMDPSWVCQLAMKTSHPSKKIRSASYPSSGIFPVGDRPANLTEHMGLVNHPFTGWWLSPTIGWFYILLIMVNISGYDDG